MLNNFIEKIYAAPAPSIDEIYDATHFDPNDSSDINAVSARVIEWIVWIGTILIFIYIIISAIMLITSNGNAEQAKKGREGLIYGVIGVIVIVLSWVLVWVIARMAKGGGTSIVPKILALDGTGTTKCIM